MRSRTRGVCAAAAMVSALVTGATSARAQNAVLASPPDSAELRELRVAVAESPTGSTIWFSARLEGAADDVYVVVPAPPGAAVDVVTDAWFEALEDTTDTRVLPPSEPPEDVCSEAKLPGVGQVDTIGDAAHVVSVQPSLPADLLTLSQLVVWAQGEGLTLSFDAMSTFAALDGSGYQFMLLRYAVPIGEVTLAPVRVVSGQASTQVPLVVTSAGAAPADLRVWAFTAGRANPTVLPWDTVDGADVSWRLSGELPLTDYRDVLSSMLDASGGASWIVDASGHSPIFRRTAMNGGAAAIPSLVEAYFERAAGYGDAETDPTECIVRAASFEASESTVAGACAPGALATVTGDPCVESPQAGQIAPDELRCGGIADDLAFALAGATPQQRWLTRWTGQLPPWTARTQDVLDVSVASARSAVLVCGGWDDSICDEPDGGVGGSGGSGGSTGGAGGSGGAVPPNVGGYGGGSAPYDPPPEDPYYEDPYYDDHTEVYIEGSCWGDSSSSTSADDSGDDSCSGDSSSSTGEEDSCSGDTSSSASEDDSCAGDSSDSADGSDSCSGDSSDSSDSGDACSGDTSDSSSGSDTCAGDSSSSSSGGDSCSGGSSSGSSSSDCAVSGRRRGRRGRLPTSAFGLLIVASGLLARRLRKAEERKVPFR